MSKGQGHTSSRQYESLANGPHNFVTTHGRCDEVTAAPAGAPSALPRRKCSQGPGPRRTIARPKPQLLPRATTHRPPQRHPGLRSHRGINEALPSCTDDSPSSLSIHPPSLSSSSTSAATPSSSSGGARLRLLGIASVWPVRNHVAHALSLGVFTFFP